MNTPLISIIIPVYNVEEYLPECMESVLSQDTSQIEMILVNDGSTDGSGEICKSYENKYEFISVIAQENSGLSEARNTGVREAKGEYLMFLDSDDLLAPDAIANMVTYITKYKTDFIFGKAVEYDNETHEYSEQPYDYRAVADIRDPVKLFLEMEKIPSFWFAAWLLIVRRDFILQNSLYFKKGLLHEDELWVPLTFLAASSAVAMDEDFYVYRINRDGSIVSTPNVKRQLDKLLIVQEFANYDAKNSCQKEILRKRQAALVFGICLSMPSFEKNPRYKELKNELKSNLSYLKYGKYKIAYYACSILGIPLGTRFLNRIV